MLMPHLLASHPETTTSAALRTLARDACWYLVARGDARGSHELAASLYEHRRSILGNDDPDTLHAAHALGWAQWSLGRYTEARDLDQDTLDRRTRTLGPDHPDTKRSASNLARDVAALEEAGRSG
jgi:hypothetical protein